MTISLIIPTYNGAHKIVNAIRSLEQQTLLPDEVIVVIDGSTDGTADILRSCDFNLPSFKIIEQPNSGRAKVRNRGAREANNSLLIFLDDDMTVSPQCVQKHLEHHQKFPNSILTGGLKEPNNLDSDFSGFRTWLNEKWFASITDIGEKPMNEENYFLTAGNCSIAKSTFDKLNGFDERLNDSEDYDLSVRAMHLRVPLFYEKDAWAFHNDNCNCKGFILRQRQYAQSQKYLTSIKPELYINKNKYEINVPTGLKGLIFQCFCNRLWINSVDKNWWTWLPSPIRFKLYDIIITANGSFFPRKVKL